MATDRQPETNKTPINKIQPDPGDKKFYIDLGILGKPKPIETPKKVHHKYTQVPRKHKPFSEERV